MKVTKPCFYDKFTCIADKCTDNCCIGWEVDIDEFSMAMYESEKSAFGERLRNAIHRDGECPTFANTAGERCALLREDGLCELVLNMGEDALCDICALHPRFFEWFGEEKEAGLGLCCEEVCRLMFAEKEPLSFVTAETDEECDGEVDERLFAFLKSARERLFALLQQRETPLAERLLSAADYARNLQERINCGDYTLPEPKSVGYDVDPIVRRYAVRSMLRTLSESEPLNDEWTERIGTLLSRSDEIADALPKFLAANSETAFQYEHIAVYALYRYFLKGCFDEDVKGKFGLAVVNTVAVAVMDCLTWLEKGSLSRWDRILNTKLYSKQADYSDEVITWLCYKLRTGIISAEQLAASLR